MADPMKERLIKKFEDEIQALDREQPVLPMMPGVPERRTHSYVRHGTTSLFAALDIASGFVIGKCYKRHRAVEFLNFLKEIDARVPEGLEVHIVMDNYGPHITEAVLTWGKSHNIRVYLTPTNGSWLNRIECQFTALKKFALQPSNNRSHEEQQAAIESYLTWRNRARDISITAWKEYKRDILQNSCAA